MHKTFHLVQSLLVNTCLLLPLLESSLQNISQKEHRPNFQVRNPNLQELLNKWLQAERYGKTVLPAQFPQECE